MHRHHPGMSNPFDRVAVCSGTALQRHHQCGNTGTPPVPVLGSHAGAGAAAVAEVADDDDVAEAAAISAKACCALAFAAAAAALA